MVKEKYCFHIREALLLSLLLHLILLITLKSYDHEIKIDIRNNPPASKPMTLYFPKIKPAEKVVPNERAPYSDADRKGKSPNKSIKDEISKPTKKGNSNFESEGFRKRYKI